MRDGYSLDDKYDLGKTLAFMTGVQALVRLPMLQRQRDEAAGLKTAGFVTGYPGSPLASYDVQLRAAAGTLAEHNVVFQPGLNEDIALTSVWGTQQVEVRGETPYDGVFALWYGKGAGLDRSGDALRHGNLAGSSPNSGALLLLGDDHKAESSSVTHNSEYVAMDHGIPLLNPADVRELVDFGLYGIALSRFSGCWVGLKCTHDVVESAASVDLKGTAVPLVQPAARSMSDAGLHLRLPDTPLEQERRLHTLRLPAVQQFLRANPLDFSPWPTPVRRLGIVTTGKTYLDILEALRELSIDTETAQRLGLGIYKVAMPWPLETLGMTEFCTGFERIMVVEEKRPVIETQIKELFYGVPGAPAVIGKFDTEKQVAFATHGTISVRQIATQILRQLRDLEVEVDLPEAARAWAGINAAPAIANAPQLLRRPSFCSGCPHNRSTVVPEGMRGGAGTGCNYMVMWMDRGSLGYTQMGADGANWIGESPFSNRGHVFQNMGDGTYNHSGILSIRAAVQAGVNITFKVLFNGVVAMTGGQEHDESLSVATIAAQLLAEGVVRVVVVADEPSRHPRGSLPAGIRLCHRDELDAVQRDLAQSGGVTALIYDQMCANEKRRLRKRGKLPDPPRRVFINSQVCEGCGDCGKVSNCVAILPVETSLGRKRAIDQSSCNKDFSCVDGFCPSFVTVHGGRLRKGRASAQAVPNPASLPMPALPALTRPFNLVLAGIGGTGVITLSAVLGTAAHLDGKGCVTLDMMGLAQKGGAVTSHLRFTRRPDTAIGARIPEQRADVVLGFDMLAAAATDSVETLRHGQTMLLVNTAETMPGEFARDTDLQFPAAATQQRLEAAAGQAQVEYIAARDMAIDATGDALATNAFLLGYAWQRGLIPLSIDSIRQAFAINGAAVAMNEAALDAGRRAAVRGPLPGPVEAPSPGAANVATLIDDRRAMLTAYQNAALAARFTSFMDRVEAAERAALGESEAFTRAVAENLSRLMTYKDEYEVARLFTDGSFDRELSSQFEGDYRLSFHLAPPLLARRDKQTGTPRKMAFGPWVRWLFRALVPMRHLRGTALDPFGYTAERRHERLLIETYQRDVLLCLSQLSPDKLAPAIEIASLPMNIRGFGHVKAASSRQSALRRADLLARFGKTGQ